MKKRNKRTNFKSVNLKRNNFKIAALFALLLILLLVLFVVGNYNQVKTSGPTGQVITGYDVTVSSSSGFLGIDWEAKWNLWKSGGGSCSGSIRKCGMFSDDESKCLASGCTWNSNIGAIGELMKYYMLILVVILIYSALSYVYFPQNGLLRLFLALATGFIATFLISSKELITLMQSYSAMGLAITAFFPLICLGALTVVTASSLKPIGIFITKMLWAGYAVILFFKTGFLFLVTKSLSYNGTSLDGKVSPLLWPFLSKIKSNVTGNWTLSQSQKQVLINAIQNYDPSMLFALGVIAVLVFIFMVVKSDWLYEWIDKMKRDSEIAARRGMQERSRAYEELNAEQMQKTGQKI